MEKAVVPDEVKSQRCGEAEESKTEVRSEVFFGSEIMPAVTVKIPMPQGAALPAQTVSAAPSETTRETVQEAIPEVIRAHEE